MKRFLSLLPAVALAVLVASAVGFAQDAALTLFDGKTLAGWKAVNGKPVGDGWEAVDGAVHRKAKLGDIVTERTFADFVLEFEFKAAPGTNSGLKYRYGRYGKQRIGLEYQVIDDPKATGPNRHTTGALYDILAPAAPRTPRPATEWNTGKIIARGNEIEHYLNGEKVVSVTLGSLEWKAALAKSKFRDQPDFGTKPGPILLQEHGGEVWFRNLRLTEIKPTGAK